jgi:hypothetical protein
MKPRAIALVVGAVAAGVLLGAAVTNPIETLARLGLEPKEQTYYVPPSMRPSNPVVPPAPPNSATPRAVPPATAVPAPVSRPSDTGGPERIAEFSTCQPMSETWMQCTGLLYGDAPICYKCGPDGWDYPTGWCAPNTQGWSCSNYGARHTD